MIHARIQSKMLFLYLIFTSSFLLPWKSKWSKVTHNASMDVLNNSEWNLQFSLKSCMKYHVGSWCNMCDWLAGIWKLFFWPINYGIKNWQWTNLHLRIDQVFPISGLNLQWQFINFLYFFSICWSIIILYTFLF